MGSLRSRLAGGWGCGWGKPGRVKCCPVYGLASLGRKRARPQAAQGAAHYQADDLDQGLPRAKSTKVATLKVEALVIHRQAHAMAACGSCLKRITSAEKPAWGFLAHSLRNVFKLTWITIRLVTEDAVTDAQR
ncbi:hypothetical protein KP05_05900 [Cobetia amphilecti]|nr:hypothetical protein KP05_05900 [Cobetia amphilecti]